MKQKLIHCHEASQKELLDEIFAGINFAVAPPCLSLTFLRLLLYITEQYKSTLVCSADDAHSYRTLKLLILIFQKSHKYRD